MSANISTSSLDSFSVVIDQMIENRKKREDEAFEKAKAELTNQIALLRDMSNEDLLEYHGSNKTSSDPRMLEIITEYKEAVYQELLFRLTSKKE